MSKKRRDAKHRKIHRLPLWIRRRQFRLLNKSEKELLGYLYSFGPDTCWLWNWRLQKEFDCSRSTIQRWLRKLRELNFIWIEKPFGPERKIHVRLLPTPEHWVQLIGTLALRKTPPKHKRPRGARRGFPPPLHEYSSPASIEQFRLDVINELVHRGSTSETAAKVADIIIAKELKKHVTRGHQKMTPISTLREKDTLLQQSGIFRSAQTLIARPTGRASRAHFSLKRRGACGSGGAVRRRPLLLNTSTKKRQACRIRPDPDFCGPQNRPGAAGPGSRVPNHPQIQTGASDMSLRKKNKRRRTRKDRHRLKRETEAIDRRAPRGRRT